MLNLKSDELKIVFQFKAGSYNDDYKVEVHTRRNSKRFDDVKKMERLAYRKQNSDWLPIETLELEQAIGLNYDNFKRTIIIPQGQFQEFLQLGAKERSEMMKELFHLEKFELYYKTSSLETENKQKLQHLDGQLQQLGEVDKDHILLKEKELVGLNNEIDKLKKELILFNEKEAKLKSLKLKNEELQDAKKKHKLLFGQKDSIDRSAKLLNEFEDCLLNFKTPLEKHKETKEQLKLIEISIVKLTEALKGREETFVALQEKLNKLKDKYTNREELLRKSEELRRLIEIRQTEKENALLRSRIEKGKKTIQEVEVKEDSFRKERAVLEKKLNSLKENTPDLEVLNTIKRWFHTKNTLTDQLTELEKEQKENNIGFDEIKQKLEELKKNILFDGIDARLTPADYQKEIQNLQLLKQKQIKELEKKNEHLLIQHKLEDFASQLGNGQACPLCGSLEHPKVWSANGISDERNELNKQKTSIEGSVQELYSLSGDFKSLSQQVLDKQKLVTAQLLKNNQLKQELIKHNGLFEWTNFHSENEYQVNKSLQDAKLASEEIKKLEELLKKNQIDLDAAIADGKKYTAAIEQFVQNNHKAESKIETLKSQIRILDISIFHEKSIDEIEQLSNNLKQEYEQLTKEFEQTQTRLENTKQVIAAEKARMESAQEQQQKHFKNLSTINQEFESKLKASPYQKLSEIESILSKNINLTEERKRISEYNNQLIILNQSIEKLELELNSNSYNPEEYASLVEVIAKQTSLLDEKNQILGKLNTEIVALITRFDKLNELIKEKKALDKRADNLSILKKLFKASGFVNYISSVHLRNLCNAANHRFYKLTGQKLQLELSEDNTFQVRDFMNGGNIRSIKTLSGGQMFQASLCLAIALVDNIQKLTQSSHNFFFLDEGFGSLDKDSLQIVFDTLKSLRKENRVVGVISHVEDMQQEIGVHLKVNNHEEKGSEIVASWEI